MKKYLFLLLFVALSCLFASTIAFGEEAKRMDEDQQRSLQDALPLHLEIISWVEVSFRGGLLKKHKNDFERFIRRRLRNDLPMLSHEVKPINELRKELIEKGFAPNLVDDELKKRGCVNCLVWTTGEDQLVVFLAECNLTGYGDYQNPRYSQFESRILDYGSTLSAQQQVEDAIKKVIARIGAEFLGAKDHLGAISGEN